VHLALGLEALGAVDQALGAVADHVALAEERAPRGLAGVARVGIEQAREGLVGLELLVLVDEIGLAGGAVRCGAAAEASRGAHDGQGSQQESDTGHGQQGIGRIRRKQGAIIGAPLKQA